MYEFDDENLFSLHNDTRLGGLLSL
jgi:hypothetical protein